MNQFGWKCEVTIDLQTLCEIQILHCTCSDVPFRVNYSLFFQKCWRNSR